MLLDVNNARIWVAAADWIVLSDGGDGFPTFLEERCFSTDKTAELEVLLAPVSPKGKGFGLLSLYRIKDTPQNRKDLYTSLDLFYGGAEEEKPTWEQFEERLKDIRPKLLAMLDEYFPLEAKKK